MPIQVTCPGCLSRFSVSDKYAGKKGPCPKCKKEIVVPDKSQQVVIHAPEVEGPKDSKGVAVLKPLRRKEFAVGWKTWTLVGVGTTVVLSLAVYLRMTGLPIAMGWLWLGAIVVAPPVAMFGYTFLRDDELDGYAGREYAARIAICSLIYAATWLVYYGLSVYFGNKVLAQIPVLPMAGFVAAMIAIGTAASLATLELEVGQSVMHYLGYLLATFALVLICGLEIAEPFAKPQTKPAATSTTVPKRIQQPKPKSPAPNQPKPAPTPQPKPPATPNK